MRWKVVLPAVMLLVLGGFGLYLILGYTVYTSHAAVVDETISAMLAHTSGLLIQQEGDLAMISGDKKIPGVGITELRAEAVELENAVPLGQSLLDDDPVYGLKANLYVTYEDGRQAGLTWETWRYGLVIGPIVLSAGDGPPGRIVSVSFIE